MTAPRFPVDTSWAEYELVGRESPGRTDKGAQHMSAPTSNNTAGVATLAAIVRLFADLALIAIAIVLILSAAGAVNLH